MTEAAQILICFLYNSRDVCEGEKEGNKAGSVGEQKMEKDKRSAGAVNVVFEEPSFRRPSLSDQTRVTAMKRFTCLSGFAFIVFRSFHALCSGTSDMDMKRHGTDSALTRRMAAAERTKPGWVGPAGASRTGNASTACLDGQSSSKTQRLVPLQSLWGRFTNSSAR